MLRLVGLVSDLYDVAKKKLRCKKHGRPNRAIPDSVFASLNDRYM